MRFLYFIGIKNLHFDHRNGGFNFIRNDENYFPKSPPPIPGIFGILLIICIICLP